MEEIDLCGALLQLWILSLFGSIGFLKKAAKNSIHSYCTLLSAAKVFKHGRTTGCMRRANSDFHLSSTASLGLRV